MEVRGKGKKELCFLGNQEVGREGPVLSRIPDQGRGAFSTDLFPSLHSDFQEHSDSQGHDRELETQW